MTVFCMLALSQCYVRHGYHKEETCLSIPGACVLKEQREGRKPLQDRVVNVITEEMSVLWEHAGGGPEEKDSCWGFLGKRDD